MLDSTPLVKVVGLLCALYFLVWPVAAVLVALTHGSVDTLRLVLNGYGSWLYALLAVVVAASAVRRSRAGRLVATQAIAYRTLGGLLVLLSLVGLSDHPDVLGRPPWWLPAAVAALALVVQLTAGREPAPPAPPS